MTNIYAIIEQETGKKTGHDTPIESLGLDSLELLDLMIVLEVPQESIPFMHTVGDIAVRGAH